MTRPLPGENAAPLSGAVEARWQATRTQISAVASAAADGTLDEETLAGGLAAVAQVPLDTTKVLNALHVPEDAGEYAADLERMLRRIPDGWGRWIGCDAGWYPLLAELDRQIAALLPEYEIHQVKEKYGTLRFYWGLPEREPACCLERQQTDSRPLPEPVSGRFAPEGRSPEVQAAMDAWFEREMTHVRSAEHVACETALREGPEAASQAAAVTKAEELVRAAETRSGIICELCGGAGAMHHRGGWYKTLCSTCAEKLNYLPTATE